MLLHFLQNSQEDTCSGISFFNNVSQNSKENTCAGASYLIKLHAEKTREIMHFFIAPHIANPKLFAPFTQCFLTYNLKVW